MGYWNGTKLPYKIEEKLRQEEHKPSKVLKWLSDNWIALLSLIVAIIAILK